MCPLALIIPACYWKSLDKSTIKSSLWPRSSFGLGNCFASVIVSSPSLPTARSCEGWGKRVATGRNFLTSRKHLYKSSEEQAGRAAGFVSYCLGGINTVQIKIRKRGLEH